MAQHVSLLAAAVLAIFSKSASSSNDQTWCNQFSSRIGILPQANDDLSVCFYEQANYVGPRCCLGKRVMSCTNANPITAPGTIGSIKFGHGCNLVANIRVSVMPYDERVDVISKDVANTGYNVSANRQSVQEIYVEEAGRACFLGYASSGDGYGICYTENVPAVNAEYRNSITELLMFKSDLKNFDVIVYENENYNNFMNFTSLGTSAMSFRITGYSKNLETNVTNNKSGTKESLQNKVRSIKFVPAESNIIAPATISAD